MNLSSLKLFALLITTFSFAQKPPAEWRFIKEVEGVKVYFRESEGSNIKEVKMQTTFNANLSSIVECLKDVDRYPKWVYKATFSKTVLKYNENDVVYYNYIDFPWPMQDRDIVVQSKITQDATTKVITSESFAKWDAEPFKKDVVRIQDFRSKWTLTPVALGKVKGEYVFRSNPGGNIPAWLVNLGLDEGPLRTLKGFKKLLSEDKYKNVDNGFKD
jgi:hypothetical protein